MPTFRANPDLFNLFHIAETLGKTVDELLNGPPQPLSPLESVYWTVYFSYKAELEEKSSKASNKGKGKGSSIQTDIAQPTMGRK